MKKIAFFDTKQYDRDFFEKLAEEYDVCFKFFETKLSIETASLAKGCDGVVIFVNDKADKEVIDALYDMGIRLIALRCAGVNNVDAKAAEGKITLVRVPAYSPNAVAEHAMALLLTLVRKTHKAFFRTRDHNFSLNGLIGFDLAGKTAGVIGTGRIGQLFINICRGFNMNVIAYDPYPISSSEINYVSLDELLSSSDIISLHCPLTKETKYIINKSTLNKMKPNAILVNTSRGGLINAEDLVEALKDKVISGACLDVYEEESEYFFEDISTEVLEDDVLARLISMPNVVLTSHQAFLTQEALENIAKTTMDNIKTFFEGGTLNNKFCYRCADK